MSNFKINSTSVKPHFNNVNNKISYPNFKKTPESDNDKVEISSDKNDKKSKALKIFIMGFIIKAIIGVVGLKLYRKHYINKAQEVFKDVFKRDNISKEETIEILKRYKNIKKIKNKDEYINALFDETKKNYGFKEGSLKLKLYNSQEHPNTGGFVYKLEPYININRDRKYFEIIESMNHEMKHKQQEYFMMNYSNDKKTWIKNISKTKLSARDLNDKSVNNFLKEHPEWMKQFNLEKLDKNNVPEKYKEYVEHLLKDLKSYEEAKLIDGNFNKNYYDNFLEADARNAGEKMKKLLAWFIPV